METTPATRQPAIVAAGELTRFKKGDDPRRHKHGRTPSRLVKYLERVREDDLDAWVAPIVKARDSENEALAATVSLRVVGMALQQERDESAATIEIRFGGGVPGDALEDDA